MKAGSGMPRVGRALIVSWSVCLMRFALDDDSQINFARRRRLQSGKRKRGRP